MADLTQLVSEGVGSPILCKASDTASSTLELPCPVKMDEFYEKVYKSDLRYFNKNLASDSKSIKGFRWNCNLTWNGLTADQIRSLQTLLNAREKLRLYHHEDYKTVYHDVYLNSSYKPEWWGDTYIVDLLNVTLKFTALSLDSTIPYHTTTAADSDTPVLGTDPTPIGMSVDLDAMFQSSAASTTTWTFEATTDEEFEPVYKINEDLSGNLYVKHLGWRYKANVKMQDITVSEYVNVVAMYNQKKDLLFTPRKRDWLTGHYTGRLAREMKIPRKDVWVGYTGSVPFEGRDLLADIDFYPAQSINLTSPDGGEIWFVGEQHNITWTGGAGNVKIEIKRGMLGTWTTIVASTPASAGAYLWTVDMPNNPVCKVKLTDTYASTDMSSASFEIRAPS